MGFPFLAENRLSARFTEFWCLTFLVLLWKHFFSTSKPKMPGKSIFGHLCEFRHWQKTGFKTTFFRFSTFSRPFFSRTLKKTRIGNILFQGLKFEFYENRSFGLQNWMFLKKSTGTLCFSLAVFKNFFTWTIFGHGHFFIFFPSFNFFTGNKTEEATNMHYLSHINRAIRVETKLNQKC